MTTLRRRVERLEESSSSGLASWPRVAVGNAAGDAFTYQREGQCVTLNLALGESVQHFRTRVAEALQPANPALLVIFGKC